MSSTSTPLAKKLEQYFALVDSHDYDAMENFLHDTKFTHRFLPATLHGLGKEERNKEEYMDQIKSLEGKVKRFNVRPPLDVVETKDAAVIHIKSDGELASGKPFTNEYVIIARFEDGKIVSIREFMDSAYVQSVAAELQ